MKQTLILYRNIQWSNRPTRSSTV